MNLKLSALLFGITYSILTKAQNQIHNIQFEFELNDSLTNETIAEIKK